MPTVTRDNIGGLEPEKFKYGMSPSNILVLEVGMCVSLVRYYLYPIPTRLARSEESPINHRVVNPGWLLGKGHAQESMNVAKLKEFFSELLLMPIGIVDDFTHR